MTLFTITGLPFSGKSTLRRALMSKLDLKCVSVDEIMSERDMWREGHPTMDDWNEAYKIAYENLKKYLRDGNDVLFDGGSLKYSERETQRKIAQELGADHKLIWVNTDIEVIFDRKFKNETTKERGSLTEAAMKTALGMFEEPNQDEDPILYNNETDFEEWFKTYF